MHQLASPRPSTTTIGGNPSSKQDSDPVNYRLLQPRPQLPLAELLNPLVTAPESPTILHTARPDSPALDPPRKKRGRPTKADTAERDRQLASREVRQTTTGAKKRGRPSKAEAAKRDRELALFKEAGLGEVVLREDSSETVYDHTKAEFLFKQLASEDSQDATARSYAELYDLVPELEELGKQSTKKKLEVVVEKVRDVKQRLEYLRSIMGRDSATKPIAKQIARHQNSRPLNVFERERAELRREADLDKNSPDKVIQVPKDRHPITYQSERSYVGRASSLHEFAQPDLIAGSARESRSVSSQARNSPPFRLADDVDSPPPQQREVLEPESNIAESPKIQRFPKAGDEDKESLNPRRSQRIARSVGQGNPTLKAQQASEHDQLVMGLSERAQQAQVVDSPNVDRRSAGLEGQNHVDRILDDLEASVDLLMELLPTIEVLPLNFGVIKGTSPSSELLHAAPSTQNQATGLVSDEQKEGKSTGSPSNISTTARQMNFTRADQPCALEAVSDRMHGTAHTTDVSRALQRSYLGMPETSNEMTEGILTRELDMIWSRIQAQPSSYIMNQVEFSVFNRYRMQPRFQNQTATEAILRYWNSRADTNSDYPKQG